MPVGRRHFRLDEYPGDDGKADFNRRVSGMQETETAHRSAGENRLHGLSGVFTVKKTGIAEEMDRNEHEEDK
jgi:hypothetical protein